MSAPMAPPLKPSSALCGRINATALWLAGPRVEARVSSPRLTMTRLALTDTPEPELDPNVVARRKIDVVRRIAAGGRAHVLSVERVLEAEDDAVHRQLFEIGIASIEGVELGGAFERVGEPSELLAHGRRAGREGT